MRKGLRNPPFFNGQGPVIIVIGLIFTSLCQFFLDQTTVFAAPLISGSGTVLSTSVSHSTVNLDFSAQEFRTAAFKNSTIQYHINTTNATGAMSYISSIDEDTHLNHSDTDIHQKFESISISLPETSFAPKTWGYRKSKTSVTGNFNPIPKRSNPDLLYSETTAVNTSYHIDFGVKSSPDLIEGTFEKQIVLTTIANPVPTTATLQNGFQFSNIVYNLNPNHDTENFKPSATPPANLATATKISTNSSTVPVYAWYDSSDKTVYWWSDADIVYADQNSAYMFGRINKYANPLKVIDARGINTSRVKMMTRMFYAGRWPIKEIILNEFDTSNVEDMSEMFTVDPFGTVTDLPEPLNLTSFDTRKVTSMRSMFSGTYNEEIDISSFDTSNVTDLSYMFDDSKVKKVYAPASLNTANVVDSTDLFHDAVNLIGGNGTTYSAANASNLNYFKIDEVGSPGLFTASP